MAKTGVQSLQVGDKGQSESSSARVWVPSFQGILHYKLSLDGEWQGSGGLAENSRTLKDSISLTSLAPSSWKDQKDSLDCP